MAATPSGTPTSTSLALDVRTVKQLRGFKPVDGQEPDFSLPDGGRYFGERHPHTGVPHGRGVALFGDGSRYGGDWLNGHQHGRGAIVAPGYEFEGQLDNDRMHGKGVVHYKESLVGLVTRGITMITPLENTIKPLEYRGDLHRDFHRHGRGVMKYRNGDVYDGEWENNCRHGTGSMICDSGEKYVGEFDNDVRCGQGTVSYPNGCVFTGTMENNKRIGMGCMVFPNGDEYCGHFDNDAITGHGTMRYKNGDLYDGEWRDGLRHGAGKFTLRKNGAAVSGNFVKGLIHGRGMVELPGKSLFVGDFEKGERRSGTLWLVDGSCYWGGWRGDAMHGKGIMWFASGDTYYGTWQASLRHGSGNMNYADGSEYSGEFSQGQRHGLGVLVSADGASVQCGVWRGDALDNGYRGEWDGRRFSGRGKLQFADGAVYDGLWLRGARAFYGVEDLKDGLRFVGSWHRDRADGMGSLRYPTGEVYQGEMSAGRREGSGMCASPASGRMFSGMFAKDAQWGAGVLYEVDPNAPILERVFATATADHTSDASSASSTVQQQGDAPTSGLLGGAGGGATPSSTEEPKSGLLSFFFGGRKASQKSNEPQYRIVGYEPSHICEGQWVNHRQCGRGRVYFPDGRVVQGTWIDGKVKIDMPHRGSVISASGGNGDGGAEARAAAATTSSSIVCSFCKNSYGFFRKQTNCLLCGRSLCFSCLKETSNIANVGIAIDNVAAAQQQIAVQHTLQQQEPTESAVATAQSLAGSFATTQALHIDANASIAASGNSIKACSDCAQCIQLKLHRGTVWDATGTIAYRGFLAGDQPHGDGSLWHGDSSFYHGAFHLGKRCGYGRLVHSNGDEYCGEWADDKMHGRGYYRSGADFVVCQGEWTDGELTSLEYFGEMTAGEGIRSGLGMAFHSDGSRYNGSWRNGVYHGMGILQMSPGDPNGAGRIYSGEFVGGRMEGVGKVVSTRSVFVGMMKNNMRNGQGTERDGDVTVSGTWIDDELCGIVSFHNRVEGTETMCVYHRGQERADVFLPVPPRSDAAVSVCHTCGTAFGLFTRKHHCRVCGNIFDHNCSKRKMTLPEQFGHGLEPRRVCMKCFVDVTEGQSVRIVYAADGTITAWTVTNGEWKGRGLRRYGSDGALRVATSAEGAGFQPSQPPATPAQVTEFVEYWTALTTACGISGLGLRDLLRPPGAPPLPLPRVSEVSFNDAELERHLFDPKSPVVTSPGAVPVIPPAPRKPQCPDPSYFTHRGRRYNADGTRAPNAALVPEMPSAETIARQLAIIRAQHDADFAVRRCTRPTVEVAVVVAEEAPKPPTDGEGVGIADERSPEPPGAEPLDEPTPPLLRSSSIRAPPSLLESSPKLERLSPTPTNTPGATTMPPPPPTPAEIARAAAAAFANFRGHINKPVPPRPQEKQHENLSWDYWRTAPCPMYDPKAAAAAAALDVASSAFDAASAAATPSGADVADPDAATARTPPSLASSAAAAAATPVTFLANLLSFGGSNSGGGGGGPQSVPSSSSAVATPTAGGGVTPTAAAPAATNESGAVDAQQQHQQFLANLATPPDFASTRAVAPIGDPQPLPFATVALRPLEGPIRLTVTMTRGGPTVAQCSIPHYAASAIPSEGHGASDSAPEEMRPLNAAAAAAAAADGPTASDVDSTQASATAARNAPVVYDAEGNRLPPPLIADGWDDDNESFGTPH